MSYIDCVKEHIMIAAFTVFAAIISYCVTCHLGWRDPIELTTGFISYITSMVIIFIVVGSCLRWYIESLK